MKRYRYSIEGLAGMESGFVYAESFQEAQRKVKEMYRRAVREYGAFRFDVSEKPTA